MFAIFKFVWSWLWFIGWLCIYNMASSTVKWSVSCFLLNRHFKGRPWHPAHAKIWWYVIEIFGSDQRIHWSPFRFQTKMIRHNHLRHIQNLLIAILVIFYGNCTLYKSHAQLHLYGCQRFLWCVTRPLCEQDLCLRLAWGYQRQVESLHQWRILLQVGIELLPHRDPAKLSFFN